MMNAENQKSPALTTRSLRSLEGTEEGRSQKQGVTPQNQ